jgi:hypothetical protein
VEEVELEVFELEPRWLVVARRGEREDRSAPGRGSGVGSRNAVEARMVFVDMGFYSVAEIWGRVLELGDYDIWVRFCLVDVVVRVE